MSTIIMGGLTRGLQGLAAAAPTLIVGLFVAAILRYYLGMRGTYRLFGGDSIRALPQSWLIGMLLPVCSLGVLPILHELRRAGVRPGAITAFALSAPLFNPLSLLYGLTLSRPIVIIGFALASLLVVTVLGIFWDRRIESPPEPPLEHDQPIGLRRLLACAVYCGRELCGTTGLLVMVGIAGVASLGMLLPHGALQTSAEQRDPLSPLRMAVVAIPIYATPMLTMSQLGMMFAHGNSPGAAFCLLLLGTGINLGTLAWVTQQYGWRPASGWLAALLTIVLACAYLVDRPLIPPGIEPAGHTHAFDIYTNPFVSQTPLSFEKFWEASKKTITVAESIGLAVLSLILVTGLLTKSRLKLPLDALIHGGHVHPLTVGRFDRIVAPWIVGIVCLAGLIAFSVVACYAYYPEPSEVLEEIKIARVEALSGVTSKHYETALYWIPIWDEWSRRLEVGYALRNFQLRPYQQAQARLLRKKLEILEHEIEHVAREGQLADAQANATDQVEAGESHPSHSHHGHDESHDHYLELRELTSSLNRTSQRLSDAFLDAPRQ